MTVFETTDDAVIWRGDGETLVVQAWGRDSLRVRSNPAGDVLDTDFALLPPEPAPVSILWGMGQYMYGPDLLVAPVIQPRATERPVYLPFGATWTDLRTGARFEGGQWITADAPIDHIPVFTRDHALPELVSAV